MQLVTSSNRLLRGQQNLFQPIRDREMHLIDQILGQIDHDHILDLIHDLTLDPHLTPDHDLHHDLDLGPTPDTLVVLKIIRCRTAAIDLTAPVIE